MDSGKEHTKTDDCMRSIASDLRFALRQIRKHPGFAAVAALTLGVGIGATTVVFSVFHATVLRRLPYPEPEQLVHLSEVSSQGERTSISEPNFLDIHDRSLSFSHLVAVSRSPMMLGGTDEPMRIDGVAATSGFFELLGAAPALGRPFLEEDFQPGNEATVVVLSHSLWQSGFGADPGIIGRTVFLDGIVRTVVGVMPRGFGFPFGSDAWYPYVPNAGAPRSEHWLDAFGRLAPAVSVDRARKEMSGIAANLGKEYPQSNRDWGVSLVPLREWLIGSRVTRIATVLLGAVGLLLLLTCASVSNLLLARATVRQRELALRATLGAGRPRILGQMVVESLVLSALGAGVGLLLAAWVLPVIRALETDALPRLNEVGVDHMVLLFTLLVAVIAGLACGAAPAFFASNEETEETLRSGERLATGSARKARDALVTGQLAIAVVLLVGAGLLVNSFVRLLYVDPGFDPENVLAAHLSVQEDNCPEPSPQVAAFYNELEERIRAIPGVRAAGASTVSPLSINRPSDFVGLEGQVSAQRDFVPVLWRAVTPGFFNAMGARLLSGRFFDKTESLMKTSPVNVVVSESLAQRLWQGKDAVGQRLVWGSPTGPSFTVVGVLADIRDVTTPEDPRPTVFLPHAAAPSPAMTLLVRVTGDAAGVVNAIRREIGAIDETVPVPQMQPLVEALDALALSGPRLNAVLVGLFAAAALGLAALGIYGITAFSVARRTREIGIRMALGAGPSTLVALALSRGVRLIVFGTAVGLAGAFGLSRFLAGMLYEIEPSDPATYLVVTLALGSVAMVANYLPARRATRVEPRVALAAE